MSTIKVLIAFVCMTSGMTMLSQSKGWHGIVPLHSTKSDVERLLGQPNEQGGFTYDTENERVTIFYSQGTCLGGVSRWNVPKDTVVSIVVAPKTSLLLSDLKVDLNRYQKELDAHMEGAAHYINKKDGIFIATRTLATDEIVLFIYYQPTPADKSLQCPSSPAPKRKSSHSMRRRWN